VAAPTRPRLRSDLVWLAFVLAGALALYLPFFRVVTWFGDEGILPHGAERILRGDRLYSDFFEFLPPGGYLLTAAWFQLTGISFGAVRSLQLLLFTGTCVLTYLACLKVLRRPAASAIAVLLWAAMALHVTWDLSHHWYTSVLCMGVLLALLHWTERPERLWLAVLAGLLGGAAAMVTPTRGTLALLAGLLAFTDLRRDWRALVTYCTAALVVPAILIGYVTALGSLHDAVQSVIVFPATRYAAIQRVPYAHNAEPFNIALAAAFPIAALLLLGRMVLRRRHIAPTRGMGLCAAFAAAAFLAIQARPDMVNLTRAVPFVLPMLLALIPFGALSRYPVARVAVGCGTALLAIVPAWFALAASRHAGTLTSVHSPRGAFSDWVAGEPPHQGRAGAIIARFAGIAPEQRVFVYPYGPLLSFLIGRVQPAPLTVITPSYTTPAQYMATCRAVMRNAAWVVYSLESDTAQWQAAYPSIPDASPPERIRFEAALEAGFAREGEYGPYALLRRRPDATTSLCEGISE